MEMSGDPRRFFVTRPLLPKRRITERVSEKGGEMTGNVAMAVKNFFPRMFVLPSTKAKRKPKAVERVAVQIPS